jgi:hypothetical protein
MQALCIVTFIVLVSKTLATSLKTDGCTDLEPLDADAERSDDEDYESGEHILPIWCQSYI